ncbi:protein required for normal CLN1 and CLN2 G1 cyclin expression [Podospora pseudoanserina]|uniref:Protein required for normal CLN1 and CLN2 G1 cyclin expression n=1 Tax=Podospora pseudoanserina TaxID=2609844 RepID=A0ABR0HKH8_9PEZI|nr:protein required for normal CLN1 and CLN2 G1 cyclin expression [Podospora pseudoanserina]
MASTYANGSLNGAANGLATHAPTSRRFADIPQTIDIPVQDSAQDQDEDPQAVEVNLEELADDPTELCTLLEMEHAARTYWMTVALAYAKQKKVDFAIEILSRGVVAMQSNQREKLTVITCLCWMYLWKSREAPRVAPEGTDARTKEYYLQQATQSLNDASRLNPAFPPLFLARGVLLLLKASLQSPSQDPNGVDVQKSEHVRNALKSFEEAIRVSHGKNMLASMGKARALFSLAKYQESLAAYQDVLAKMPDLVDPDPRIGVGCCLWQLGYKDDAKGAWERSLEISPDSKIAKILLGLYYLDASSQVPTNSPEFLRYYKKAMTEYTQDSFKRDKNLPLTCATFAGYFLARKQFPNVDSLAHKAIQYTDVNAIASDGWYLLARKEHYEGNLDKASDYYRRADDARGGVERGYLPAKFGLAQLSVLRNDLGEAKLRLEKMIQQSKNLEAMILLGTLYAEEVFANQTAAIKEDKTAETKKALTYLEAVRTAWKDPKKGMLPDAAVLLNLARLYETEFPDRALQCLQQVEQLEIDQVPKSEYPADAEDQAVIRSAIRKHLPPQLLNNIGCFYSQDGKHQLATEYFQAALDSCARISSLNDTEVDTDALLTTISFNLGRSYEYEGDVDKAIETYERLLSRHSNYTDARARLAYIKLRKNPNKEGPDAVAKLYQDNPSDLEVRALYGWFLGKLSAKKRPANINEDPEHRHYKHTLQNYDKHDRYALVGMGNLLLGSAREMRRESEQDRQKRSSMYSRAVEFFDKALQLEPKNAYAAQGVAIALVEDKKDAKTALQAFLKVKETVQDAHVFVNLGHIYTELGQFSKAIESYEIALSKEGKANDAGILSCLGRTWLNKARTDKKFIEHYNMALEYAQKALKVAPEQAHFKFNVAYVQIMLADTLRQFASQDRNSFQLEQAAEGLEQAIKTLDEIAAGPNPPYPKHDIEQRANMARNTVRNQLNRALQAQKEYEAKNKEKRDAAIQQRQAELRRKEEERRKAEEAERFRQEKIRKEREEIAARDRILAEQRAEEEKARMEAELTTDSETGEKVKRKKRSGGGGGERARRERSGEPSTQRPRKGRAEKKKKGSRRRDETGDEESDAGEGGGRAPPKKRVRLASRKEAEKGGKYKSAEIVVDSSDEGGGGYNGEEDPLERTERKMDRNSKRSSRSEDRSSGTEDEEDTYRRGANTRRQRSEGSDDEGDRMAVDRESSPQIRDDDEEEETVTRRQAKRSRRAGRVVDSDEEEEDEGGAGEGGGEKEEEQREDKADVSMADVGDDDEE